MKTENGASSTKELTKSGGTHTVTESDKDEPSEKGERPEASGLELIGDKSRLARERKKQP